MADGDETATTEARDPFGPFGPYDADGYAICSCNDGVRPLQFCGSHDVLVAATLPGPTLPIDEYPSSLFPSLSRLATALMESTPGVIVYTFEESAPTGTAGTFLEYRYLVQSDADGGMLRLVGEGELVTTGDGKVYTSPGAIEQVDPAALARLNVECTQPYAQLRWACVHEILSTAPATELCPAPAR